MMNRINRVTKKYGSFVMISIGVLFIIIGLSLQLRKVEKFENYNPKSRFNREIKATKKTSTAISYFIGVGLVLLGIKKKWIFRKKKTIKANQGKLLKLRPE